MSLTIVMVGVAGAVIVGFGVGLQILDARVTLAQSDSDNEADELEFGEDCAETAQQGAARTLPRSTSDRRKKRKHGR